MDSFNIYAHATQRQIDNFKPTYLYIKRHTITGKLYFGKTTLSEKRLLKYTGSGTRWSLHVSKHGKKVETDWYCLFTDIETLVFTALALSESMGIVASDTFLNLKPEDGLSGGNCGNYSHRKTPEYRSRQSKRLKEACQKESSERKEQRKRVGSESGKKTLGKPKPKGHGHKVSMATKGVPKSESHIQSIREAAKNRPLMSCIHCRSVVNSQTLSRHHKNCD